MCVVDVRECVVFVFADGERVPEAGCDLSHNPSACACAFTSGLVSSLSVTVHLNFLQVQYLFASVGRDGTPPRPLLSHDSLYRTSLRGGGMLHLECFFLVSVLSLQ